MPGDSMKVEPVFATQTTPQTAFRRTWLLPLGLGVWAYLCHALAVLLFSDALPIADQWDSEGYLLLKPWIEGNLQISGLVANHNEHRILFKRLLDLAVFTLNGNHWDNRVLALFNAAVYAAAMSVLAAIIIHLTQRPARPVLLAFTALLPLAAVSLDNTLWAFQSPFFFSSLFAYAAIYLVARDRPTTRGNIAALLLCAGAIATLGSGFLLPLSLSFMLVGRRLLGDAGARRALGWAGLAFALGVAGYCWMPSLPYHEPFKAQNLAELLETLNRVLAWPLTKAPLGWLPLLAWAVISWRRGRKPTAADRFFLGLACWVALQAAAIAYGRGHATAVVPSRYTEFLLAGLVANLYFLCQIVAQWRFSTFSRIAVTILPLTTAVTLVALTEQSLLMAYPIAHRLSVWQAGRPLINGMLAGLPVAADHVALPYPNRDKLAMFLTDPGMRKLLGVENNRLPLPCDPAHAGPLSQLVCALEQQIGKPALPVFTPDAAVATADLPASRCNLDFVDAGAEPGVISRVLPSRFFGWAGPGTRPIDLLRGTGVLRLEGDAGRFEIPLGMPIERPDVAAFTGSREYQWAGFDQMASPAELPAGEYAVVLQRPGSAPCIAVQRVRLP